MRRIGPLLGSAAVHLAVVGVAIWFALRPETDAQIGTPIAGPSLNFAEGEKYVGRYRLESARGQTLIDIDLISDGSGPREHWSLLARDGQAQPRKLVVVARDTFSYQSGGTARVVFVRARDSVAAIELHAGTETRRGARAPER